MQLTLFLICFSLNYIYSKPIHITPIYCYDQENIFENRVYCNNGEYITVPPIKDDKIPPSPEYQKIIDQFELYLKNRQKSETLSGQNIYH